MWSAVSEANKYMQNAHLDNYWRIGKIWHLRSHCTTCDTLQKAAKIKQAHQTFGTATPHNKEMTDFLLS